MMHGGPTRVTNLYQATLIKIHVMGLRGPPGRRGSKSDACASVEGRNAPGGPRIPTGGRFPLTARGVALRLWCAHHGANRSLRADKGNRSNESLSAPLGIM